MLAHAESLLQHGKSVILDASWLRQCWRDEAAGVATRAYATLVGLRCEAPRELTDARLVKRSLARSDPSDATTQIADAMAEAVEPWIDSAVVETSGLLQDSVEEALSLLGLAYRSERDTW
jgi:predicted kinase